MALKIIDLDIDESLSADTRVAEVGWVLQPAIETEFMYFSNDRMDADTLKKVKDYVQNQMKVKEYEMESYNDYPEEASNNACKVLKWIDEYGRDEVDGMTETGLARANQLCNRENLSEETIGRMAAFERHRKNSTISPEYKGTPWKDKGYVAWLGWGGDAGVEWATRKLEQIKRKENMAEVGERGGIKESPKAPKSDTPNKNPKGEGSAKGSASTTRGAEVSKRVEETLQNKSDDFNERYKDKLGYGVNVGMLKSVYQRGVGAYNVSHSPEVKSAEQWALARVNAFLYLVKNGRPENPKYDGDYDLLPEKHPKKTSSEDMDYDTGSLPTYVDYATGDTKNDMLIEPILFVERNPGESKDDYISRCVEYHIKNEGMEADQAYAICISKTEEFLRGDKVSFDYDDTLSTARGMGLALHEKFQGSTLYIISARSNPSGMYAAADRLGIPHSRVFATGSNQRKIQKIKDLGITKHYDNNVDVIKELGNRGIKFSCPCLDEVSSKGQEIFEIMEQFNLVGFIDGQPIFSTPNEAEDYANEIGCYGHHIHKDENGNDVYMACESHGAKITSVGQENINVFSEFSIEDYDDEDKEVIALLKFLADTDYEKFEDVVSKMKGRTEEEVKALNHKNKTVYFQYARKIERAAEDRPECMEIEGKFFRRLEIDLLRNTALEYGHNKQPYSKWLWKFGPNCFHAWKRFFVQGNTMLDQGWVEGQPGNSMMGETPNNGYYSPETKRKSEVAYIISQQNSKQVFKADNEQRMIYTPLMIPNILIPRLDNGEKYYVRFKPEVIEKIRNKFMTEGRLRDTNYEHSDHKFNDVVMVESWIISGPNDKAYDLGFTKEQAPIGTWMGGYKVLDTTEGNTIWNDYVKTGLVRGASVEGEFLMRFSKQYEQNSMFGKITTNKLFN